MKSVAIIGIGALGSHVVLCARNWKAQIKVIDFDRVEQKNTMAQFHGTLTLRQNKAQSIRQTMRGMFGTNIEAVPHRLTDDNVKALLGSMDIVIDCTDNLAARTCIQKFVRAHDTPCLHGAVAADGSFARILWDDLFVADSEGAEGQPTCEDGEHLAFYVSVGAQMAIRVESFLSTGRKLSCQMTRCGLVEI